MLTGEDTWLDDAKRARGAHGPMRRGIRRIHAALIDWRYQFVFRLLSRPGHLQALRIITGLLRRITPVAKIGPAVVTTTHAATLEVLSTPNRFNAAEDITPRLPAGDFVLGIDWARRHIQERETVDAALGIGKSADRLRGIARRGFQRALEAAKDNQLNVARDLAEDIALDLAVEHFGVGREAKREELREIFRVLASRVFQAPPTGSADEVRARLASDRLASITGQSSAPDRDPGQETVLDRLRAEVAARPSRKGGAAGFEFDAIWPERNASSLAVFGTATLSRAITQAAYRLLTLPCAAETARAAARPFANGGPEAKDRQQVLDVIQEALRFNPMLPILASRTAVNDTTLGSGTPHRAIVAAGTSVLPLTYAAMFDPSAFEEPGCFALRGNGAAYLHFGAGPHACPGRNVAEIVMVETIGHLFALPDLQISDRNGGRIVYSGPAVEAFWVRWT